MAKFTLIVDVPHSETRAVEVHHVLKALELAAHDIGSQVGNKHGGPHPLTMPADRPGEERIEVGEWSYEPSAAVADRHPGAHQRLDGAGAIDDIFGPVTVRTR